MRNITNINVLIEYLKKRKPALDCNDIYIQNKYKKSLDFQIWCLREKNMQSTDIVEIAEKLNTDSRWYYGKKHKYINRIYKNKLPRWR